MESRTTLGLRYQHAFPLEGKMRYLRQASGFAAVAVLFLFASAGTASAGWYDWTLSGGGDTGSGMLETGAVDGGGYDVISFTGFIDGDAVALFGGQPGPTGTYTPSDYFYFDNILYPTSNPGTSNCAGGNTVVDGCGIAFTINGGYGNIWDNYTGKGTGPDVYSTAPPANVNYDATFTIAAVPEPASLSLLALAAAGVGLIRRRKIV
jgi:hypothetical protein